MTEDRRQKAEVRRQKTEVGGQRAEVRRLKTLRIAPKIVFP